MPVAEGDVIQLLQQALVELEAVVGAARVVVVGIEIGRCEAVHRAMGQQDAWFALGQVIPVQLPHPGCGVAAVAAAQQRAGQHHGLVQLQRLTFEQNLQVGGTPLLFRPEEGAVPHAAGSAVIMVAGNHQHRDRQLTDRLAHGAHVAGAGCGGIKQITGHQQK